MQMSSMFFLVAPAALIIFIGLTLLPLVGYLQEALSRQLTQQQLTFDDLLLRKEIEIREQGYQQLSLELHDGVGHMLSVAKWHLDTGPPGSSSEAISMIEAALESLRNISRSLNADLLHCDGLSKCLELGLAQISRSGQCQTRLCQTGEPYFLSDQTDLTLLRISQECLTNIIKHSGASRVSIVLDYQPKLFTITITDNGKGFKSWVEEKEPTGCGLSNIRKRCRIINASLQISSELGIGTIVIIKIPVYDKRSAGTQN